MLWSLLFSSALAGSSVDIDQLRTAPAAKAAALLDKGRSPGGAFAAAYHPRARGHGEVLADPTAYVGSIKVSRFWQRAKFDIDVLYTHGSSRPTEELVLRVPPWDVAKGLLDVQALQVDGRDVSTKREGSVLVISADRLLRQGDVVRVRMRGKVNLGESTLGARRSSGGRLSVRHRTVHLLDFLPVLTRFDDRSGWDKRQLSEHADSHAFEQSLFALDIDLPGSHEVASTGTIVSDARKGGRRRVRSVAVARQYGAILLRGFELAERKVGSTALRVYASPARKQHLEDAADTAESALRWQLQRFGELPHADLEVIEAPMHGNPLVDQHGLVVFHEEDPGPARRAVLAHGMAHQYWFAEVGNDAIDHAWLDEGLATWTAHAMARDLWGDDPAPIRSSWLQQKLDAETNGDEPVLAAMAAKHWTDADHYRLATHGAGARFLDAIEGEKGTYAVIGSLRTYLEANHCGHATPHNLIDALIAGVGDERAVKRLYAQYVGSGY
jgi:hypothetical protein